MSNYTIPRAPPRGLFSSFPPKSIDNTKSSNSNETQTLLNSNLKGKNGDGIDGGVDRGIGGGAPLPPMLRGDHPGELSLAKHVYAAPGAILSYLSFGFSSNLHFLVPMSVGYASMLLFRKHCGIATFLLGFGYLIGCHVFYMSGDVWKEGGIDATGSLMVLTLKVISCAINYNDGVLKEEVLREAQKKDRLIKMPSLIEYFGYCLSCGSHFAGPVYEMKDYLDWTESKGIWSPSEKGQSPSPVGAAIRALLQAAFCMGLYLYMVPLDKIYRAHIPRMGFLETIRIPVYVRIYSTVEILFHMVNFRGLHYSFWSPKPKWDRAKNVDVLGVELAKSSVQLPLVWNIQVTTWLRHYVYERLFMPGKKAGFFQLLATQTISAVWHGLYPGYIIFFVQSALMFKRWHQSVPQGAKNIMVFLNFAYTVLVLNYSCVGFIVLSLHETVASYGSVYYIGTVLPIVLILLGKIIKPARPVKKVRKEE